MSDTPKTDIKKLMHSRLDALIDGSRAWEIELEEKLRQIDDMDEIQGIKPRKIKIGDGWGWFILNMLQFLHTLQEKYLPELERENAELRMQLDASCNAEELRQIREDNRELRRDKERLDWLLENCWCEQDLDVDPYMRADTRTFDTRSQIDAAMNNKKKEESNE